MKILVLGANGMLGNAVYRLLAADTRLEVVGTVRSATAGQVLGVNNRGSIMANVDVLHTDSLIQTFGSTHPDVVINCIGMVKQLAAANDPLLTLPINCMLPHRLAALGQAAGARLVHVSTDCVFDGRKGHYREEDPLDSSDLYGRSKALGEVDCPHAITLRTSIIGHELTSKHGLLEWFLAQQGSVNGFRRAVFSGLPTVELATIIRDQVLPRPELHGIYHVASEAINKFDLLTLIASAYGKEIEIKPDDRLVIDRSLDAGRFQQSTGYQADRWPELIRRMRLFG
jgi:dTDP-4-dehydrorhamnose reductase